MLAIKTLRLVNAEYLTAFRASPFFSFVSNELPDAELFDVLKIFDHAHAILGSISLIQIVQPGTGEAVTTVAVIDFSFIHLLAVLYQTDDASFRFDTVVASAARAWILISCVCDAEAAVHSAGRD